MKSVLLNWMRLAWFCSAPFGLLFTARIAWEKTVWTWSRGPQAIGFSLMHIHPLFFAVGSLSAYLLILWLVPGVIYIVKRRRTASGVDKLLLLFSLLVLVVAIIPDDFFATSR
jgi:hypothetical protein